ncbi:MAG: glycoside hydrolase family 2 TIM barrel-domain containing protein [Acetatifactor sp.]
MYTEILKSGWKFYLGDCEEAWYKGYDDSGWRGVTVPHDWSVELPMRKEYSSGTGYVAGGIGWYRVRFRLPEECRGKAVKVVFDGVYKNSQVWCNSYYLGKRPYGYSTFSYDITHAVAFGETENVICVKVTHTDIADSRWFTGSGITRKVSIVCEEPVHPEEYGIVFRAENIEVEDIDIVENGSGNNTGSNLTVAGNAELSVRHKPVCAEGLGAILMENSGSADAQKVRIQTVLEDNTGKAVLTLEGNTPVGTECTLRGRLEHAALWSPEHPYLYTMKTRYAVGDGAFYPVDEQRIGIRSIFFDPEKGFFLNGKETKLKGVCVHHDGGCLGAAMEPEVWQRRLLALKECGCNAIRCSHNPHMPELYSLCDAMGFMMMDEAFDEWENAKNKWSTGHNVYPPKHQGYFEDFPQWYDADLRAMVRRDRNHPSVVLWSIGNEIDYPNDPYCHPSFADMTGNNDANKPAAERQYDANKPNAERLVTIAAKLERIVREEDDSRPVTLAAAFPELSAQTGLLNGLDVVGYNYKEHLYEKDHARFPEKPFLGSENGHGYQAWLAVKENAYISGQFLWTGIDYLGESRGEWPTHGSAAGILTCAGDKKPEFYRRQAFWEEEPVIALATRRVSDGSEDWLPMMEHWNYHSGEEILVKVFSNLPVVALELNGNRVGKLSGYNGDGAFCFRVSYEPGVLRAVGGIKEDGNVVPDTRKPNQMRYADETGAVHYIAELSTAGEAKQLSCQVWKKPDALSGESWERVSRDFGYLYQLEMQLLDGEDQPVHWQEKEISVEVTGDGVLAGLESGDLSDASPYFGTKRMTFSGRLLAFVRRTGADDISVKIRMEDKTLEVRL